MILIIRLNGSLHERLKNGLELPNFKKMANQATIAVMGLNLSLAVSNLSDAGDLVELKRNVVIDVGT